MSKKIIDIIGKNVSMNPQFETIEPSVEAMQNRIHENGATFDAVGFPDNITMWVDDEGLLNDSKLNLVVTVGKFPTHHIHGNVFFTGIDSDGDTIGLTEKQKASIINSFHLLPQMVEGRFIYVFDVEMLKEGLNQWESVQRDKKQN